jgi:hypothetical protein
VQDIQKTVAAIEHGESNVSLQTLKAIADALRVQD